MEAVNSYLLSTQSAWESIVYVFEKGMEVVTALVARLCILSQGIFSAGHLDPCRVAGRR